MIPPLFSRLIKAVKSLAENIPVKENTNMTISTKNLAVGVAVLPASKSTQGFYIRGEKDLNRTNLKMKRMGENQARTEIVDIYLPAGLLSKAKGGGTQGIRITTFLYDNHKLFYSKSTSGMEATKRFNSKIFDVSVKGRKILNLTETERIRSEFASINGSQREEMLQCVYWEDSKRGRRCFELFRTRSSLAKLRETRSLLAHTRAASKFTLGNKYGSCCHRHRGR